MDSSKVSATSRKTEKSSTRPRLHKRNFKGETELHVACKRQDLTEVKALVNSGIDVNCPDFAGWTALHEAAATGDRAVVEVLLRAGARVNARSVDGRTPLHDAAVSNSCEVVKLLLQHSADPQDKDVGGHSAADVAQSSEMRALLLSFQRSTPGASGSEPQCTAAPPVHENVTTQRGKALALVLSEVQEKLTQVGGLSLPGQLDTEKHCTALWDIHSTLTQALAQQHIDKDNLAHKYWSVPNCLRKVLKSELISLASAQDKLVTVIQKQMQAVEEYNIRHKQSSFCPAPASAQERPKLQVVSTISQSSSNPSTVTLTQAQGNKAPTATLVQAQGNKAPTATLVQAQGNKALTATLVQAQGNKAPTATLVPSQGKALTATLVPPQGNKALTGTLVPAQEQLWTARDVRLQNNSAGQTQQTLNDNSTSAPSTTRRQPHPGVVQAHSEGTGPWRRPRPVSNLRLSVEHMQSCGVEQRKDVEEPHSPSLLDSGSGSDSEVVDCLALLMNLKVVHVVGDDELVPKALMDQCWEQLLKEDSWSF